MSTVELLVATHKKSEIELPPYCKKIQVNAEKNGRWDGYLHDNDYPDNLSQKNNTYCELTALHWLWKCSRAEIGGLFHYRRFLSGETDLTLFNECNVSRSEEEIGNSIISEKRIEELLYDADVIVELQKAPFPLTTYEDLQKFVYLDDIWKLIEIIETKYSDYTESLWAVLRSTNISYCNMFIAKRKFIDDYCRWLFSVLSDMELCIPILQYDVNHQRILGYFAEILMNVYILHNGIKSKKVKRIDLFEKDGLAKKKQTIKSIINTTLSKLGIYPIGSYRKLNKARYRVCKGETIEIGELNGLKDSEKAAKAKAFLHKTGGVGIKERKADTFYHLEGSYYTTKMHYYICEDGAALQHILEEVHDLKKEQIRFGQANVFRVISNEKVDFDRNILLREGITLQT